MKPKRDGLLEDTHQEYSLRLDQTEVEGAPVIRYRFESRQRTRGQTAQVTYCLDAADHRKLYRVESQDAGQPVLVSTRSGFDESGWPRVWTSQSIDALGRVITKQVRYLGGVDQDFDDWEIFAPVFPKDYLVSVSSGSGVAELIQNPRGGRRVPDITGPARSLLSQVAPILLCLIFIGLPLALMRRWGARRRL